MHENQGGVEVIIVLLDVISIILGHLFLVHCVEIKASVAILDGLEERYKSILEAMLAQW